MDQKHAGVGTGSDDHVISFGPFRFDRRGLHLSAHGKPVRVQPKALQVLRCLVARPREVVLKDEIMRLVWHDTIVSEGALAEAIHVLRQALGDDPRAPEFIETVHTRGYRFIGDVVSGDGGSEGAARRTEPTVAAPARAVVPAATTTFRGINNETRSRRARPRFRRRCGRRRPGAGRSSLRWPGRRHASRSERVPIQGAPRR